MIVLWLIAPLVLAALAAGVGLLVERAGGHRLPGPLVVVVGFTGMVCVSQVTVRFGALAPATPWVVLALAIAGFVVGRRRRPDGWVVALAAAVYLVFGLPAIAAGEPTLLGYTNLGDAAGHFGIVSQVMDQGYSIENLVTSSYSARTDELFLTAYPTGSHTVLGTLRALTGTDVAWLLQPYLAMLAALTALGLHTLVAPFVRGRALAAGVAALAACAGLVYAYGVNQQAVKELGALVCIVALVGVVRPLLLAPPTWRAGIPAAVAAGGGLGVLSLALGPWIAPLLAVAALALLVRHGPRVLITFLVFGALAFLLALPSTLTRTAAFVRTTDVSLTGVEVGNLYAPLELEQALGVWPSGDFREALPPSRDFTWILVAVAAALGAALAVQRRAWPPLLFAVVSVIGYFAVAGRASPWAEAKALMLLSPVALLLAGFAAARLWELRRRIPAVLLGGALAVGVAWTDALSYHVVDVAPYERLDELAEIGERFGGSERASLYLESEEFAKHFLRDMSPHSANEAIPQGILQPAPGVTPKFGYTADTDDFRPAVLARQYEYLVLRRGPKHSRPPAGWERTFTGDHYDVWAQGDGDVLAHLALGGRLDPAAAAPCGEVERIAGVARAAGGRLAWAPRPRLVSLVPTVVPRPGEWQVESLDPESLRPFGAGTVAGGIELAEAGDYHVWVEASVGRTLEVLIDDRLVGTADELNPHYTATRVGTVTLAEGGHGVRLRFGGGTLEPGDGSRNRVLGPVFLTPARDPGDVEVRTVDPADWRQVCGEHADWVEAVR